MYLIIFQNTYEAKFANVTDQIRYCVIQSLISSIYFIHSIFSPLMRSYLHFNYCLQKTDVADTPHPTKKSKRRKTKDINKTIEDTILEGVDAKNKGKATGMKSGQRKKKRGKVII